MPLSLRAPKERGNLEVVEFIPSNKTEIGQTVPSAAKNPAPHNDTEFTEHLPSFFSSNERLAASDEFNIIIKDRDSK